MASLFKKKTVDDVIKEQNRELRGTQRAIIRDRAALEKQEKQLELEIKKMAKIGNKEACRVLAKQLVHLRKQKTRTFAVSSKVTSMSTQTKVMNSQMKMAGAMSTTANGSKRCPEAKRLSGRGSLVKAASCRTSSKIPKACWHTRDSQKTCK